jgi:hypothetical protein
MKKLMCKFLCIMNLLNTARAASVLSRRGNHDLANKLMTSQEKCEC